MDVQDFFYLAHYDNHFIDNFLNELMNNKLLKKHYTVKDVHYFVIQITLNEEFLFENFKTYDIGEVTIARLSKICVKDAISIRQISDIINVVRIKSNYYPILKSASLYSRHDEINMKINIDYYVTIALVPDSYTGSLEDI